MYLVHLYLRDIHIGSQMNPLIMHNIHRFQRPGSLVPDDLPAFLIDSHFGRYTGSAKAQP